MKLRGWFSVFLITFAGVLFFKGIEKNSVIDTFEEKRMQMIKHQIESRGVRNRSVLEAMRAVERHLFVPDQYQKFA